MAKIEAIRVWAELLVPQLKGVDPEQRPFQF